MTFDSSVETWCDQLPEATGDHALFVADVFLQKSKRVSNPPTQRYLVDHEMRGKTYFDKGYCLKLRPFARS